MTTRRPQIEGTVTQLRQRAPWVLAALYKSRKPPVCGIIRITDRQIERSSNQTSYNGLQGITNLGIIVICSRSELLLTKLPSQSSRRAYFHPYMAKFFFYFSYFRLDFLLDKKCSFSLQYISDRCFLFCARLKVKRASPNFDNPPRTYYYYSVERRYRSKNLRN